MDLRNLADVTWLRQFFLYGLVGVLATLVDWGSFYAANSLAGMHYAASTGIGFSLGTVANFILNRTITFRNKSRRIGLQLGVFAVIAAVSLLMSVGWMYVLVDVAGVRPMFSRVATTFIMYAVNFCMQKLIVFNPRVIQ